MLISLGAYNKFKTHTDLHKKLKLPKKRFNFHLKLQNYFIDTFNI